MSQLVGRNRTNQEDRSHFEFVARCGNGSGGADAAALGNKLAAELYDLPIQVPNVEDEASNVTRFFVVGSEQARPTGR